VSPRPRPPQRAPSRAPRSAISGPHPVTQAGTRRCRPTAEQRPTRCRTEHLPSTTHLQRGTTRGSGSEQLDDQSGGHRSSTELGTTSVLRPTTKAVDASLLLARCLTPEPMRRATPTRCGCRSTLPFRRLLDIDARLEQATTRPVIAPGIIVCHPPTTPSASAPPCAVILPTAEAQRLVLVVPPLSSGAVGEAARPAGADRVAGRVAPPRRGRSASSPAVLSFQARLKGAPFVNDCATILAAPTVPQVPPITMPATPASLPEAPAAALLLLSGLAAGAAALRRRDR